MNWDFKRTVTFWKVRLKQVCVQQKKVLDKSFHFVFSFFLSSKSPQAVAQLDISYGVDYEPFKVRSVLTMIFFLFLCWFLFYLVQLLLFLLFLLLVVVFLLMLFHILSPNHSFCEAQSLYITININSYVISFPPPGPISDGLFQSYY